jgi:hypothetical protein
MGKAMKDFAALSHPLQGRQFFVGIDTPAKLA